MKSAKGSDSGSLNVVVDLKRKRSAIPCETNYTEVTKRIRLNGSSPSGKNMVKYYSDFKKSGLAHRLMYNDNGEWNDFPQEIVTSLKEDLLMKRTAAEIDLDGNRILLDFLHMVRVDLNTGLHQPIAWIDDAGKCFFPVVCGEENEGADLVVSDDLKLHLEVEIKGLDSLTVKEPSGEANHEGSAEKDDEDYEGADSCLHDSNAEAEENAIPAAAPVNGPIDLHTLNELFIDGIDPDDQVEIVEIQRCTSNALDARLQLFQKQIEITEKYREDANVVHAWLPCSGRMVPSIVNYGIGYPAPAGNMNPMRGIYLTPANGSYISSSLETDENGARHVVFCRVIMGDMEFIPAGSNRFHPSSEDFDSGADDLHYPNQYIVWDMNVNTHICPEYVITYRLSSDVEGPPPETDSSGASSSSQEESVVINPSPERYSSVPVMPFSVLLNALRDTVSSDSMELVMANYELFSNEEIGRDEFIKKLRLIVGDAPLKSVVKEIRSKVNPPN